MTKKAIIAELRHILASTPQQQEVTGRNRDVVLVVLEHHPDRTRWPLTQGGVSKVTVGRWEGKYHTPCFYLHYGNGEVWDFSFYKCVRNMSATDVSGICSRFGL